MIDFNNKITQFIKLNTTAISKSRSHNLFPILTFFDDKKAVFTCKGTTKLPYEITIEYSNEIKINCTCPYDYGGICKHSIASLEKLKLVIKNEKAVDVVDTPKATFVNSATIFKVDDKIKYPLKNGVIDEELIINDLKKHAYYSYTTYIVIEATNDKIITQVDSWSREKQNFYYNRKNEELEISCSCKNKTKQKYCEHLYPAFQKIIKLFGNNYFEDGYLDKKIEEYIKDFGLNLEDDYEKYFEFKFGREGFIVEHLFPNLQKINVPYENAAVDQNTAKNAYSKKHSELANALIFEFSDCEFREFTPAQAKYNKERTELATHFKTIQIYNLEDSIDFYSEEFVQIILKSVKLSNTLNKISSGKNKDYFSKSIPLFNEFVSVIRNYPIYEHQLRNTYTRKNLIPLSIVDQEMEIIFDLKEDLLFYQLEPKIKIGNKNYKLNSSKLQISPYFVKKETEIFPIKNPVLSADLQYYLQNSNSNYIKKNQDDFKEKILLPITKKYQLNIDQIKITKEISKSYTLEKQVYIEDLDEIVGFKLAVQYPEKLIDVASKELRLSTDKEGNFSQIERDTNFENQFLVEFKNLHSEFQNQEEEFYLNAQQLIENFWFLEFSEKLKNLGITLLGTKELKSFKYNLNKPTINVSVQSDIDWFDVSIDISFGDQNLSLKELQKAFIKKSNFVVLGDGSIGILPKDWMEKFSGYFKAGEMKKEKLQISNFQFGIIDELYDELEVKPDFLVQLYEKKKRIQNIENIEKIAVPKGIKAKLRDYQTHGLNWLNFLDQHQLGGCLADDMGLGKTLQMIAFMQHLKLTKKPKDASLIIAPTSLIFNWENEINKFCPTLKLLIFTGVNRAELVSKFNKYDLIITTYGSILNDAEYLKDIDFNYVILDESQAIKNPNSKRYKSVRLLKAYNRVVLTGTPIENNTFDLYAQFNFVNPGLLGNMAHFKKEFSDAIDKEKEVETSELLAKIISPFILRRTKEQVATELPEKVENVIFCEMEKEQRKVYDAFKNKYRDYLLTKIDENGIGKAQMYILEGLTKLRQICNSPAILSDKEEYTKESIKLDTLMENILEKTGNHKILVFSSFVKMLQLIKNRLEENNVTYEYLDGQTKDRQNRVENFQNQEDVRVFLISLKAGGTGLNLTEADYVFMIDPWWNPAVENQAIDRCYRIGQKKQVMAYRMICKDTIEEKILNLQQKKTKIANSIISVDEEKKSFNTQEVKDLFA